MKKTICFVFGHKFDFITCPYTKNTYKTCTRCTKDNHKEMSFN